VIDVMVLPSSSAVYQARWLPAGDTITAVKRTVSDPQFDSGLVDRIDAVLPQTQCARCGCAGCLPYAQAVAEGAPLNRCPPGGPALIATLALLTGRPPLPPDESCGAHGPLQVARIDEAQCIGCVLCIHACPVDAIAGGAKRMHAVIDAWCTGCGLCLPPCPVDCITLVAAGREWSPEDARAARDRHRAHKPGGARRQAQATRMQQAPASATSQSTRAVRQDAVAAALARARTRRAARRATPAGS
jgi:electron transport complex protein RnfB